MKKHLLLIITLFILSLVIPSMSFAQGMMDGDETVVPKNNGHTAEGEAEGKVLWERLQAKEFGCENLSDEDFHALGMYFMGLMASDSHEAMDTMMTQMMGEEGEDQMHIAMGKRMSNCESDAPLPQNMMGGGMMSMMMGMVGGGGNPMMGSFSTNPMGIFGWSFGWVFMILFWGLIILGIIVLIRWIANQGKNQDQGKSALDILKERYAKGEIDKKEFEEKKKDLS